MKYFLEEAYKGIYSELSLELKVKNIAQTAKITKQISRHILRNSFASKRLENTRDIHYINLFLRHSYIKTWEQLTHILNRAQAILAITLKKNISNTTKDTKTLFKCALGKKTEYLFHNNKKIFDT